MTSSRVHKWVEIFFSVARLMAISQAIARFPKPLQPLMKLWAIPRRVKEEVQMMDQLNEVSVLHQCLRASKAKGITPS